MILLEFTDVHSHVSGILKNVLGDLDKVTFV